MRVRLNRHKRSLEFWFLEITELCRLSLLFLIALILLHRYYLRKKNIKLIRKIQINRRKLSD